jgi:hypothetical protein
MKLLRFDDDGKARLGVVKGEEIIPLDALAVDYPTMLAIIEGGAAAPSIPGSAKWWPRQLAASR